MAQGTRFMRKGRTKFFFLSAIADAGFDPTTTEITAGVDISKDVAAVNGFSFSSSPIDTPDFEDTFTKQIPGEDTAAESSLEMYQRDRHATNTDLNYEALPKGAIGFIVVVPDGFADGTAIAVGDTVDVWPVEIMSRAKTYTADNTAAKYTVSFSIREIPNEDFVIAA